MRLWGRIKLKQMQWDQNKIRNWAKVDNTLDTALIILLNLMVHMDRPSRENWRATNAIEMKTPKIADPWSKT